MVGGRSATGFPKEFRRSVTCLPPKFQKANMDFFLAFLIVGMFEIP